MYTSVEASDIDTNVHSLFDTFSSVLQHIFVSVTDAQAFKQVHNEKYEDTDAFSLVDKINVVIIKFEYKRGLCRFRCPLSPSSY